MSTVTRKIGLSLGADVCWPMCFEDILQRLELAIRLGGDVVRFEAERVNIEPFDVAPLPKYDLIIDRLTHWYAPRREWIKKAVILDGTYVWNNPWSVQAMEKHTTYCAMLRLGMPVPETRVLPAKAYDDKPDLQVTLNRYARLFDVAQQGESVGYPLFMKPFDGGAWVGVSKVDNGKQLAQAYEGSGKHVMLLQRGIVPFEMFVRGLAIGPQFRVLKYDPGAPLHARYLPDVDFLSEADHDVVRDSTLAINAFFGWDFNTCEMLLAAGTWYPIDFANPCPDSQVTSLHVHFPWLVIAKLRWAIFCAATRRKFRHNCDWEPFFAVAAGKQPYRQKLKAYADLARKRFDSDRFEEFCADYLAHLPEVAWEYFGTARAKEAVRRKVEALYPRHEWDEFTERFWSGVQTWREREAVRR
jgi:hypothetical protein